jgi:exocyst complex component 7
VESLSKAAKRQAFGSIFVLNNMDYMYKYLVSDPENPAVLNLMSKPTKNAIQSGFRTAKATYFDANFSPLMQALTDDPKDKGGKAGAKEKFTRFYDLLDEVVERHRIARVLEDDQEGREAIGEDIIKLVVPSLQRFTQKYRDKDSRSELLVLLLINPGC